MHPLDKLAREICWAGFACPKLVGRTKAQYWKDLTDEKRTEYRLEAERWAYLHGRIDVDVMNAVSTLSHPNGAGQE